MNKEEFQNLPARLALGLAWDALNLGDKLGAVAAPRPPLPPKYDLKVFRKGGFNWASEMSLESLVFWHRKAIESSTSGSQYAEKDAKKAANLERWIKWRECEPDVLWAGERDNKKATGAAPSRDPRLHDNEPRGATAPPSDQYDDAPPDDDSIPF
jgi:hypothetical protein